MKKRLIHALLVAVVSGLLALAGTAPLGQPGPLPDSVVLGIDL